MLHGRVVYFGSATDMLPYFIRLDYPCNSNIEMNPADFALDTLNQVVSTPAADALYQAYTQSSMNIRQSDVRMQDESGIIRNPKRPFY